jgi:3-oxoisoapionate decarboxylase
MPLASDAASPVRTSLGLVAYCFNIARAAHVEFPEVPDYADPIVFVEQAARLGAGAVQIAYGTREGEYIRRLREAAEKTGIVLEATVNIPKTESDLSRFDAELRTLRELGVNIARTVLIPGRRYEQFQSLEAFRAAVDQAYKSVRLAEPVAARHGIRLAIENHKDQRIEERLKLLEHFSSEQIGACIDIGNNIALLEDPVELARAFAPWALTVHYKDQAVCEFADGFLLADIPLGEGCIDLRETMKVIREKKRKVVFHLELITRDALPVPVLTERYWATLGDLRAPQLASTWRELKTRASSKSFPVISALSKKEQVQTERHNIEQSMRFAAEHLGFSV